MRARRTLSYGEGMPSKALEVGEGKLTTVGLVGEHTADDVLEHLGRRATVEGTARWLGQVTLFQVVDDLELVAVEVAGDDESLATDDNDLLALEQALGDGGGQATH